MIQNQQVDNSLMDINLQNIQDQPKDTVSSIQWIPQINSNIFACGTWDGTVKIYDINQMNQLYQKTQFLGSDPITALNWKNDSTQIYAASDDTIKSFDTNTGVPTILGKHESAITGLHYLDNNLLMSCSLDKTIKFWQNNCPNPIACINFDHKIYVSDHFQGITTLALSNEKLAIFDLQQLQNLPQNRWTVYMDSPTQTQIASIMVQKMQDNTLFMGVGSQDGRTNISSILKAQNGIFRMNHIMTFKCHKIEDQQKNVEVFQVSGIQGNIKNSKWLCTSGGDGKIIIWDIELKNKIKEFTYLNQPVTKLKVHPNGNYFAYALGNDWTEGIWGLEKNYKPKIVVHQLQPNEIKVN